MLEIRDLHATVAGKPILNGLSLSITAMALAACGDASGAGGEQRAAAGAASGEFPSAVAYEGCVRSYLSSDAGSTPRMDAVKGALSACRSQLRQAAIDELSRAPAFAKAAPPEDQILTVMARREGLLARDLNPGFPIV